MSLYYFTVANLPALMYSHKPAITIDEFLQSCRSTLSPADFRQLEVLSLAEPQQAGTRLPLLRKWRDWELNLRNTLAALRAREKGLSPAGYLKPVVDIFSAQRSAQQAFAEESPLKAEEVLEKARWQWLDELEVGHYFDLTKLCLYYLKLQLLIRKYTFETARGEARYREVMNSYIDLINSRENRYVK